MKLLSQDDLMGQNNQLISNTRAVLSHELRMLFFLPSIYLFQGFFLLAISSCVFLVADFYSSDEASINLLIVFFPWVSLIFVPALMMRMWPSDVMDRSAELTLTLPIQYSSIVFGKFLASFLFLLLTLSFTLPIPLTVVYLGEPDLGVIFAGYLAMICFLATFCAVSLFFVALVKEPVGAYVLSVAFLFILLVLGWDVFSRFLKEIAPAYFIDILALYSPYSWLTRMSQGLVEYRALLSFLIVICSSLFFTRLVIGFKFRQNNSILKNSIKTISTIGLVLSISLLIPIVSQVPGKIDLTEAGEFSLHKGTANVIKKISSEAELVFYWSASESSIPIAIKSHAKRVRGLIGEIVSSSQGKLKFREVDPVPDSDHELSALSDGLKRIPMTSGDSFMFGLTLTSMRGTINIPYFDLRRAKLTEYDLAVSLDALTRESEQRVGIISPLIPSSAGLRNNEGMSFISELKKAYDLAIIPHFKDKLPPKLDVLVLIDATILRKEMLYAIDQFVMGGGGLIVMLDPYTRFNRASNLVNPKPSSELNDISDLLDKYGLSYNSNWVIGDSSFSAMAVDRNQESIDYPFWLRIRSQGLSGSHPVTASLNEIFMVESGSFKISKPSNITSLIETTKKSGLLNRESFMRKTPSQLSNNFKSDGKRRLISGIISGPLVSSFKEPIKGVREDQFRKKSINNPIVIGVGDVDWIFDPFSLQKTEVDGRIVVRPLNDNLNFLLNMVEFASGEQSLIEIRSRGIIHRPFSRVLRLVNLAKEKYREEEALLERQAEEVELKMKRLLNKSSDKEYLKIQDDVRTNVKIFRQDLLELRGKLRKVRLQLRSEVNKLGQIVTALNMFSGPILTFILALMAFMMRKKKF